VKEIAETCPKDIEVNNVVHFETFDPESLCQLATSL
jgi:hypothetical protein